MRRRKKYIAKSPSKRPQLRAMLLTAEHLLGLLQRWGVPGNTNVDGFRIVSRVISARISEVPAFTVKLFNYFSCATL